MVAVRVWKSAFHPCLEPEGLFQHCELKIASKLRKVQNWASGSQISTEDFCIRILFYTWHNEAHCRLLIELAVNLTTLRTQGPFYNHLSYYAALTKRTGLILRMTVPDDASTSCQEGPKWAIWTWCFVLFQPHSTSKIGHWFLNLCYSNQCFFLF